MANGVPTLEDVANLAGVCKSTASRILAAKVGSKLPFSARTQSRVRNAVQMLGYKPSKLARSLAQTKTWIVGLVIPSIKDSFFPSVTSVIESRLAENGYNVILSNTNGDSALEREKVEDLLSWRVDGFIIAPLQATGDAGLFWKLWQSKVPFVLIDRSFPDTPFRSVTTDDRAGGVMAVEHLVSIGRKRIAWVGGAMSVSTNRLRHTGYLEAVMRAGFAPGRQDPIEVSPTEEGGRIAFGLLAKQEPHPDSVFCSTDQIAIGIIEACRQHGVRVPEDLAVVGYADLHYSGLLRTALTTIRQPCQLIGERAAELLLREMEGRGDSDASPLPVELVVRDSTVPQSEEVVRNRHHLLDW